MKGCCLCLCIMLSSRKDASFGVRISNFAHKTDFYTHSLHIAEIWCFLEKVCCDRKFLLESYLFCILFHWLANNNLVMLTNYFSYIIHVISICDIQSVGICPTPTGLQHACKYRYQSTFSSSVVTQQSGNLPFTHGKWNAAYCLQ